MRAAAQRFFRRASRHGLPVLWLSALAIFPATAAPSTWTIGALRDPEQARNFLMTLWQVDASAVAFSLAVLLFAYELIWSSRYRGTFREFAGEISLSYVVALGFAAIFSIAAVLLDYGSGAPGGWAATWATGWSIVALLALPAVFARALHVIDPEQLHRRRLQQLAAAAQEAVDAEALKRLAHDALREYANLVGVHAQAFWFGAVPAGAEYVRSRREGVVSDVRLRRLRLLGPGHPVAANGQPVPGALVYLDEPIDERTPIVAIPRNSGRVRRWAARHLVKVGPRPHRRRLADTIEQLHEDALTAIRETRPNTYEDICEYYTELLVGFAAAWKRYGMDFTPQVAGEIDLLGRGPLDWVTQNIYEELREVLTHENRELARSVVALPYRIAHRGITLNASALLIEFLRLYGWIYRNARDAKDREVSETVASRAIRLPFELGRLYIAHEITDDETSAERREQLALLLQYTWNTAAFVAQQVMEYEPADLTRPGEISTFWLDFFTVWNPEYQAPYDWQIDHARRQWGQDDPRTRELEELAEHFGAQAKTKDDLIAWRETHFFGLAYWALHRLQATQDAVWAPQHEHWAGHVTSPDRLARAAGRAVENAMFWYEWRSAEDRSRAGIGPNVDLDLLRAYLVMTLRVVPPTLTPPAIDPPDFLRWRLPEIEQMLAGVLNDQQLWGLLRPPDELARRGVAVRRMLRDAQARLPAPANS